MTVGAALSAGTREIGQRKKLVWLCYGLNLLFAIGIAAPLALVMATALGESMENQRLFANFDISWIFEIASSAQYQQLIAWMPVALALLSTFVLAATWLSGGVLGVLHNPEDSFFASCARWFPPFLRLLVFSFAGYAFAFACRALVRAIVRKLTDDSMSGRPHALGSIAAFLVFCAIFLLINLVADYAKVHMVLHRDRTARRGVSGAIRFVFQHKVQVFSIYGALTLLGLAMLAGYDLVSEGIGQSSGIAVFLLLIVRQIYLFGRSWLRLVFLAASYAFRAGERQPEVAVVTPPRFSPEEALEFNESV